MPTQKFQEFPASFESDLKTLLEKRYSRDYFFSTELPAIFNLLFSNDPNQEDAKAFDDFISLADYKRKVTTVAEKIGFEIADFQEKDGKNFKIPYLYGLVISSYFIKMARDVFISSNMKQNKNSINFFDDFLDGNFDKITDEDINDFYQIFSNSLKIGIFSKAFKRNFNQMTFSQDEPFCGLLPPDNNNQYHNFAVFIENNIDFISNNYQTTFRFKRDIILIKKAFIEETSNKFDAIVDKLTEKNTLSKLIMVSPDNEMYKNLVVNIKKRASIDTNRFRKKLMLNKFYSTTPSIKFELAHSEESDSTISSDAKFENINLDLPEDMTMLNDLFLKFPSLSPDLICSDETDSTITSGPEFEDIDLDLPEIKLPNNEFFSSSRYVDINFILSDVTDSSITSDSEFENIGAQIPLEDKAMLATLLKVKVSTHISSLSNFPSQMIYKFLKKTLADISEIEDDFQYFCEQSLNLIDTYISAGKNPPTGMRLITEVYQSISSQKSEKTNNTIMLSPLTEKEIKTLKAHFS
ncbi:MAG: hypothetical protein PHO29_02150 [Acetobacterium sp.]|nr:hypothetical protein [Acetobacterium sp.]